MSGGAKEDSSSTLGKDKDIASSHRINESKVSDSDSVETISAPRTSPRRAKDSGSNRKKTGRYFTDLSYLNRLSRQERQRIEGEMIKGRKAGECIKMSHMHSNRSTHDIAIIAGAVYILYMYRNMEPWNLNH